MNIIESAKQASTQYESLSEFQEKDGVNFNILRMNGVKIQSHIDPSVTLSVIHSTRACHQDGKLHADGKPAVICSNGTELWYQHGRLHRTCGPAIITKNGINFWYLNNIELTHIEWLAS